MEREERRQCPGIRQRTHRLGLRRNHHRAGKHRRAVLVADRSGNTLDSQLKTAGDAFQSASSSEPDVRYPYDYRWISPRTFDSGFGADFVSGLSNGYNAAKLVRGSGSTENSPVFSFDESGLLEGGRYIDNTRTRARTRAAMRDTFHQWFGIRIRQNQLTDSPANQVYMPSGNHED